MSSVPRAPWRSQRRDNKTPLSDSACGSGLSPVREEVRSAGPCAAIHAPRSAARAIHPPRRIKKKDIPQRNVSGKPLMPGGFIPPGQMKSNGRSDAARREAQKRSTGFASASFLSLLGKIDISTENHDFINHI